MTVVGSDPWLYVALVVVGFLPSEVWRVLGFLIGRSIDEDSEVFIWVRAVATATLAAVVASLCFYPVGLLGRLGVEWRAIALIAGIGSFFLARRSVLVGVLVAETIIIVGYLATV